MLHTDFFNKNNKHKMQKQDYIKNTSTAMLNEGVSTDIMEVSISHSRPQSRYPRGANVAGYERAWSMSLTGLVFLSQYHLYPIH